jgi:exodeoxyribonuclease-5
MAHKLTEEQQNAVNKIVSSTSRAVALSGSAGTGKTTTIREIVGRKLLEGAVVMCTAPTNQAVKELMKGVGSNLDEQLKENCGEPEEFGELYFVTLHSYLGIRLQRHETAQIYKQGKTKLPRADFLIVDEASMVDRKMLEQIKADPAKQILFVGDNAQLPPVKEKVSLVFDAVKNQRIPGVELKKVMRQAEGGQLLQVCQLLRRSVENTIPVSLFAEVQEISGEKPDGSIQVVRKADPDLRSRLNSLFCEHPPGDVKILAWRNKRVDEWNELIKLQLRSSRNASPERSIDPYLLDDFIVMREPVVKENIITARVGDKFLVGGVTKGPHPIYEDEKAYHIDAYRYENRALSGKPTKLFVPMDRLAHQKAVKQFAQKVSTGIFGPPKNNWHRYYAYLDSWHTGVAHGYAGTTHTAQGQTIPHVCVDIQDFSMCRDVAQRQRLLYTAISRAKKSALLLI